MADYYPLIARAVAGLDKNTGENRRALYERARSALVNQLRSVEPALDESDITRERLALEEAIRKLEAEAAERAREQGAPDDGAPSLRDQALRDFRDSFAEAEGLGEASAEATRSARAAYDDMDEPRASQPLPGDAPPETRPRFVPAASDEPADTYFQPPADEKADRDFADRDLANRDLADRDFADARHDADDRHADAYPASDDQRRAMDSDAQQDAARDAAHDLPQDLPPPRAAAPWQGRPPLPSAPPADDDDIYTRPQRSYGRIAAIVVVLMLIGGLAAVGYWQRNAVMATYNQVMASLTSPSTPTPATPPAATTQTPAGRPKITDRIGAGDDASSRAANAPAAAVAQKVVLYDEDTNDPQGKRYVGSAVWRTETVSPGAGMAPELAIRADVEIPERRMRMTWSLRRNTDKALPASHTIEIMFTLPADFPENGIGNVPGVLMKQNEQARGVPLAGLSVKVTNGYFLVGLSSVGIDQQRNVQLLKERDWFDIPIVYASGKRAILAVEKGTPGARAFEEAFRAWGE